MSIQINNNVLSKGWERFTIMHKDRKVAAIREDGTCTVYAPSFMPYNLYLETAKDLDTRLNNLNNFYYWCSSRILTLDRRFAKEILNSIGAKQAEETAQEIEEEHKERLSPFTFSKCNISAGEFVSWYDDPDMQFKVLDEKTVEYKGKPFSLSALAALILGKDGSAGVAGPRYFKYKGEWLNEIRHRLES